MAASTDLLSTFKAAIQDFNKAQQVGNYDNFLPYLYYSVVIQKVDDPGAVSGTPYDIVYKYLNPYEAANGNFPQFDYGSPRTNEHSNKAEELVGEVVGQGKYWDTYADYSSVPQVPGTSVQYCLRFKRENAGNIWLLAAAVVVPI